MTYLSVGYVLCFTSLALCLVPNPPFLLILFQTAIGFAGCVTVLEAGRGERP